MVPFEIVKQKSSDLAEDQKCKPEPFTEQRRGGSLALQNFLQQPQFILHFSSLIYTSTTLFRRSIASRNVDLPAPALSLLPPARSRRPSHSNRMVIRCVLLDIGGVCVGSPITGANNAEKLWGLPPHYINAHITAQGHGGAFQRLERGELDLETFYKQFGAELSNVETGNAAYKVYCKRVGKGEYFSGLKARGTVGRLTIDSQNVRHCPPHSTLMAKRCVLIAEIRPATEAAALTVLTLQLWTHMMEPALTPDPVIVGAINALRSQLPPSRVSRRFADLFRDDSIQQVPSWRPHK